LEHHGDEEKAREEARRGMQLIDARIAYPAEPQPAKMDKGEIEKIQKTLEELLKSMKKKS
jgi:hypothetical protein